MKITKKQLRQIIKEELEEANGGRIGAPYSGVVPADEVEPEGPTSVTTIEELLAAISAGAPVVRMNLENSERNLLGQMLVNYLGQ